LPVRDRYRSKGSGTRVRALPLLLIALLSLRCGNGQSEKAQPPLQPESLSLTGSPLIIPMDTDVSGNHCPSPPTICFNQDRGMWKAYGLVFRLLENGIPVYWAIRPYRLRRRRFHRDDGDRQTHRDGHRPWAYRGEPFIINGPDVAAANRSSTPGGRRAAASNIHVAGSAFANVDITCAVRRASPASPSTPPSRLPTITLPIPDLLGKPWSTHRPTSSRDGDRQRSTVHAGRLPAAAVRHLCHATAAGIPTR
jgi:hypothetical protein